MKASLKRGNILIGTFVLEFGRSAIATLLAHAGAEFIITDLEHSSFAIETVEEIIPDARGENLPCIVRVPVLEHHFVSRILEGGAIGVMIPWENRVKFSKKSENGQNTVSRLVSD